MLFEIPKQRRKKSFAALDAALEKLEKDLKALK